MIFAYTLAIVSSTLQPRPLLVQPEFIDTPSLIFFDEKKSRITKEAIAIIDYFVEEQKRITGECTVFVTGYSDSLNFEPDGQSLSLLRARAAAQILIEKGIPEAKIVVSGVGDKESLVDQKGLKAEAQNRRVVLSHCGVTSR